MTTSPVAGPRFDHVVVAVRDLDSAVEQFTGLGFVVRHGGRHVGRGTHNAIVRFGVAYLELMSAYDEDLARTHPFGAHLLRSLAGREGGLLGYVVAVDDVAAVAARLAEKGIEANGPIAMGRERPDGSRLGWQMLVPGPITWRRPLPFVIQWDEADDVRVRADAPAPHPNGARGVKRISVAVGDIDAAVRSYEAALGVRPEGPATRGLARYTFGGVRVDLRDPGDRGIRDTIKAEGEGLSELVLEGDGPTFGTLAAYGGRIAIEPRKVRC